MKKIVSYGMENYAYNEVEITPVLEEVNVLNGIPASGELFDDAVITPEVENYGEILSVLMNQNEQPEVMVEQKKELNAPIEAGEEIGDVIYSLNGEVIGRYPVIVSTEIKEKDFTWTFSKILEMYALQ